MNCHHQMRASTILVAALSLGASGSARAQATGCDLTGMPALVWYGRDVQMPIAKLAALAAPVLWFSPDEPLLKRTQGADIRIPEAMPSEPVPAGPVLYYQIEDVLTRGRDDGTVVTRDANGNAISLNLLHVQALHLSYYAYYHAEEGLGAHPHDVEPAEFRLGVLTRDEAVSRGVARAAACSADTRLIVLVRMTGKAHALVFYWNVLESDIGLRMPMTLLVEEGKHALATDKNSDGIFTPGYDVNRRVNDAWGVRDIISTGALYAGGFESWMSKTRRPEHRVFPPLPDDSPQQGEMASMKAGGSYATYELRVLPSVASAAGDHNLEHLLADKYLAGWPMTQTLDNPRAIRKWIGEGTALKSFSLAAQYDGAFGLAWSFPFFIVRHLENPMNGGYILQRMYVRGEHLRDFGWELLMTRSASRWIEGYGAAGAEVVHTTDSLTQERTGKWDFVLETGVKLRVNLAFAPGPAKVLSKITPFWGVRMGLRYSGAFDVNRLRYVVEFGAGAF